MDVAGTNTAADRLGRALTRAEDWHSGQVRKGSTIPYLSHLMSVASLVMEDGGDQDQVIAALLHDAAEDQGGEATLAAIKDEFGPRVESIVRACSDSLETDPTMKADWHTRKRAAIANFASESTDALVVSAADKLHNLRSTVLDLSLIGDSVWDRFKTGREGFLWYHDEVLAVLQQRIPDSRSVRAFAIEMADLHTQMG